MISRATESACARARRAIEARFDGEAGDVTRIEAETHIGRCAACRAFARELRAVRDLMADLPGAPFDDEALEAVWDRTIRTADDRWRRSPRSWGRAAAAVIAVAAVTVAVVRVTGPSGREDPGMSEAALAELDADVQAALLIVSDALGRAERIAVVDVLAGRTSPVFDIVGLDGEGMSAEPTWSLP